MVRPYTFYRKVITMIDTIATFFSAIVTAVQDGLNSLVSSL